MCSTKNDDHTQYSDTFVALVRFRTFSCTKRMRFKYFAKSFIIDSATILKKLPENACESDKIICTASESKNENTLRKTLR